MTMRVAVVGPKVTPPWDSALASFSWNLTVALLRTFRGNVSICKNDTIQFHIFTQRPRVGEYVNFYGKKVLPSIKEDWELFSKELTQYGWYIFLHCYSKDEFVVPILHLNMNNHALCFFVQPTLLQLMFAMPGKLASSKTYFIDIARSYRETIFPLGLFNKVKILKTYLHPADSNFIPPGIDTSLFKPDTFMKYYSFERIKVLIDELRDHVDYVFSFFGPVFGKRTSIFHILKIITKIEKRIGMRVGLLGFIAIRHKSDFYYIRQTLEYMRNHGLTKYVKLSSQILSIPAKVALCNYSDVHLYPIMNPVEISDPPFSVLEYSACEKPSIFLSYGILKKLYPVKECTYQQYSIDNVVKAAKRCLNVESHKRKMLRFMVERYFSLTQLVRKMHTLIENCL